MKKRLITMILSICMICTSVPNGAFAEEILPDTVDCGETAVIEETVEETEAVEEILEETVAVKEETEDETVTETETPLDPASYAEGKLGLRVNWVWYNDGEVYIYGTGPMYDYDEDDNLYEYSDKATTIKIGSGVTTVADYLFTGWENVTSVSLPSSLTTLGEGSFMECTGLQSISLPDSVIGIPDECFSACTSLTAINIPGKATSIGSGAFFGCKSLSEVSLPSNLKTIDEYAFVDCPSLKSITIPPSVTKIGSEALGYEINNSGDTTPVRSFVIKGYTGSVAEKYAKSNGFRFESIGIIPSSINDITNVYGGVQLTWNACDEAYKYAVYYRVSGSSAWKKATITKNTQYTKRSLQSGVTYEFCVKALTKKGKVIDYYNSTPASIFYLAAPKVATKRSDDELTVYWGRVTGASRYRIYTRSAGATSWRVLAETTDTSYVVSNWNDQVEACELYYYYTVCIDSDGKEISGYNPVGVTGVIVPGASIYEIYTAKGSMYVEWYMGDENLTGYQIQYSTNAKFKSGVKNVYSLGTEKDGKTIKNLKHNKFYFVRLRNYVKIGKKTYYSDWSETWYAYIR